MEPLLMPPVSQRCPGSYIDSMLPSSSHHTLLFSCSKEVETWVDHSSVILILHPMSTHPTYFWWIMLPQKQEIPEKTWWWHHHQVFSGISCFWGSKVCQKYAVWVLVVCRIKFFIQWALPIEIWVKTQGDMSKIRTQKVVFFFLPPKLINIILLF